MTSAPPPAQHTVFLPPWSSKGSFSWSYHALMQFRHPTLLLHEREQQHHASPCPAATQKLMARVSYSVLSTWGTDQILAFLPHFLSQGHMLNMARFSQALSSQI